MLQIVADTIAVHHMLEDCRNLIVGISGGADSVCLLSFLSNYIQQNHLPIQIVAAHVNHGLRGEAADADETQVVRLCNRLSIPLRIKHCDVGALAKEQGVSVEMAGRNVRYAFFQELAEDLPQCKIAVAHHRDDRAETILWNVIRGTGLDGLKGIPYVRDNVIRPLLDVPKKEILEYCKVQNLPVCEDASNSETIYSRNKIRLDLLPYIKERFQTNITEKILRLSDNILPDEDFLQQMAQQAYVSCMKHETALDKKAFLRLHPAMQIRVLKKFYPQTLEQVHLQKLLQFVQNAATGKKLLLPGGWEVKMQYDMVLLQPVSATTEQKDFCYVAEGSFVIECLSVKVTCKVQPTQGETVHFSNQSTTQIFDYDLLMKACDAQKNTLCVRNREEGDYIRPWKGNGQKTLKKFFIDEKIPREMRDAVPLLTMGHEVLWVMGQRRCEEYLPSANTKQYFVVSLENV